MHLHICIFHTNIQILHICIFHIPSSLGVGRSCLELLLRGHNTSGLYHLQSRSPVSSHWGAAQKAAEEEEEARVGGMEGGRDEAEIPHGYVGYCDMTTMGGGWLMCYTSRDDVDLANEVFTET